VRVSDWRFLINSSKTSGLDPLAPQFWGYQLSADTLSTQHSVN
jgi:hypothetical protein